MWFSLPVFKQCSTSCRVNPTKPLLFDGAGLHPYDALFVKMKERHLQTNDDTTVSALRYQEWLNTAVRSHNSMSKYISCNSIMYHAAAVSEACFCSMPRVTCH